MASERLTWTCEAVKNLIVQYEQNDFLYNTNSESYKDRDKRLAKHKEISEALQEYVPGCTAQDVKKKINGLRSQYLTEKMKIRKSKKSGSDTEKIYKPSVYWFPLLSFLGNSTKPDISQSSLDESPNNEDMNITMNEEHSTADDINVEDTAGDESRVPPTKRKRKTVTNSPEKKLLNEAMLTMRQMSALTSKNTAVQKEDSHDIFGKFVASELRTMSHHDSILLRTKRRIQQAIMDAWEALETRSESCTLYSSSWGSTSATPEPNPFHTESVYASNDGGLQHNHDSVSLIDTALEQAEIIFE